MQPVRGIAHDIRRAAVLLAALSACSAPDEWPAPPMSPAWSHHAGPFIAGVRPESAPPLDADPAQALALHALVIAVADLPEDGTRLASEARLVLTDSGDGSLGGVARLLDGALLARDDEARALAEWLPGAKVASVTVLAEAALPVDCTATLDLGLHGVDREVRLLVSRPSRDVQALAIVVRGPNTPAHEDEDLGQQPLERREAIVLQPLLGADGAPIVLGLPLHLPAHPRAGLLVALQAVTAAPDDATHVEAVARAVQDAQRAAVESRASAAELTSSEAFLSQVVSAFASLGDETSRRAALSFLASASGAALCGDLALLADPVTLERLARRIDDLGQDLASLVQEGGGLGWLLERSAWELLAARAAEEPLPAEQQAELLRHAGEAGRYPASLLDAIEACHSVAELRARIAGENRIFLEDPKAASRVRASEWLAARGLRPAGYDPLAPLTERRAALAAAEAEAVERAGAEPEP